MVGGEDDESLLAGAGVTVGEAEIDWTSKETAMN